MDKNTTQGFGTVAVLMGGDSAERGISFKSGAAVLNSLQQSGIDAVGIEVNAETDIVEVLIQKAVDRAFIMLHGRNGEDGKVQAILESIKMPYTGSGVKASALCMDKVSCKELWLKLGLNTPKFLVLTEESNFEEVLEELGTCFVKPVTEGSSFGIGKAHSTLELKAAYKNASQFDSAVIAEEWVNGPEYTVGILGNKVLPVIELKTKNEFYDFDAKYEADDTQYLCPCDLNEKETNEIQTLAKNAYDTTGCSGWARVDLMRDETGKFWLLEVNTIPGMTNHSLVPMAAQEIGIGFDELVIEMLSSSHIKRG